MPHAGTLSVDTVIFGGGAAGLWLLDTLVRRGETVVLLESNDLGSGQTIASQGIIHGGLKYTLSGLLTRSAQSIREMPMIWRRCLAGESVPNLAATRVRAPFCHLWRTTSLTSRLGMIGARAGLRIAPTPLQPDERPASLASCPGQVARLDEQVIDPASFLADLAAQHRQRLFKIDSGSGLEFDRDSQDNITLVRLINPDTGEPLDIVPRAVVLAAGQGNAALREQLHLPQNVMQRRPLHMVLARGELPTLNGHCVDGSATRLTITTAQDFADRAIWQIGGQIAEHGVNLDRSSLINHAISELHAALPDVSLAGVEWSTYTVDRAEAAAGGQRPESPFVIREGNTFTAWPTKLALVPILAEQIAAQLEQPSSQPHELPPWSRPAVAAPPWEDAQWIAAHSA